MKTRLTFVLTVLALALIALFVGLSMEVFATDPRNPWAEAYVIRTLAIWAGAFVVVLLYRVFMPQK